MSNAIINLSSGFTSYFAFPAVQSIFSRMEEDLGCTLSLEDEEDVPRLTIACAIECVETVMDTVASVERTLEKIPHPSLDSDEEAVPAEEQQRAAAEAELEATLPTLKEKERRDIRTKRIQQVLDLITISFGGHRNRNFAGTDNICLLCPETVIVPPTFRSKESMRHHLMTLHLTKWWSLKDEMPFKCPTCGASFEDVTHLMPHFESHHLEKMLRKYGLPKEKCVKGTPANDDEEAAVKLKSLSCTEAKRFRKERAGRVQDLTSYAFGEERVCLLCPKTVVLPSPFYSHDSYRYHLGHHHLTNLYSLSTPSPYNCPKCDKSFGTDNLDQLVPHFAEAHAPLMQGYELGSGAGDRVFEPGPTRVPPSSANRVTRRSKGIPKPTPSAEKPADPPDSSDSATRTTRRTRQRNVKEKRADLQDKRPSSVKNKSPKDPPNADDDDLPKSVTRKIRTPKSTKIGKKFLRPSASGRSLKPYRELMANAIADPSPGTGQDTSMTEDQYQEDAPSMDDTNFEVADAEAPSTSGISNKTAPKSDSVVVQEVQLGRKQSGTVRPSKRKPRPYKRKNVDSNQRPVSKNPPLDNDPVVDVANTPTSKKRRLEGDVNAVTVQQLAAKGKTGFRCIICLSGPGSKSRVFSSMAGLEQHVLRADHSWRRGGNDRLKCSLCRFTAVDPLLLMPHRRTVHASRFVRSTTHRAPLLPEASNLLLPGPSAEVPAGTFGGNHDQSLAEFLDVSATNLAQDSTEQTSPKSRKLSAPHRLEKELAIDMVIDYSVRSGKRSRSNEALKQPHLIAKSGAKTFKISLDRCDHLVPPGAWEKLASLTVSPDQSESDDELSDDELVPKEESSAKSSSSAVALPVIPKPNAVVIQKVEAGRDASASGSGPADDSPSRRSSRKSTVQHEVSMSSTEVGLAQPKCDGSTADVVMTKTLDRPVRSRKSATRFSPDVAKTSPSTSSELGVRSRRGRPTAPIPPSQTEVTLTIPSKGAKHVPDESSMTMAAEIDPDTSPPSDPSSSKSAPVTASPIAVILPRITLPASTIFPQTYEDSVDSDSDTSSAGTPEREVAHASTSAVKLKTLKPAAATLAGVEGFAGETADLADVPGTSTESHSRRDSPSPDSSLPPASPRRPSRKRSAYTRFGCKPFCVKLTQCDTLYAKMIADAVLRRTFEKEKVEKAAKLCKHPETYHPRPVTKVPSKDLGWTLLPIDQDAPSTSGVVPSTPTTRITTRPLAADRRPTGDPLDAMISKISTRAIYKDKGCSFSGYGQDRGRSSDSVELEPAEHYAFVPPPQEPGLEGGTLLISLIGDEEYGRPRPPVGPSNGPINDPPVAVPMTSRERPSRDVIDGPSTSRSQAGTGDVMGDNLTEADEQNIRDFVNSKDTSTDHPEQDSSADTASEAEELSATDMQNIQDFLSQEDTETMDAPESNPITPVPSLGDLYPDIVMPHDAPTVSTNGDLSTVSGAAYVEPSDVLAIDNHCSTFSANEDLPTTAISANGELSTYSANQKWPSPNLMSANVELSAASIDERPTVVPESEYLEKSDPEASPAVSDNIDQPHSVAAESTGSASNDLDQLAKFLEESVTTDRPASTPGTEAMRASSAAAGTTRPDVSEGSKKKRKKHSRTQSATPEISVTRTVSRKGDGSVRAARAEKAQSLSLLAARYGFMRKLSGRNTPERSKGGYVPKRPNSAASSGSGTSGRQSKPATPDQRPGTLDKAGKKRKKPAKPQESNVGQGVGGGRGQRINYGAGQSEAHVCLVCHTTFPTYSGLKRHLIRLHLKGVAQTLTPQGVLQGVPGQMAKCLFCKFTHHLPEMLKAHMRTVHQKKRIQNIVWARIKPHKSK